MKALDIVMNAGIRWEFILKMFEKPGMSPSSPLCNLNYKHLSKPDKQGQGIGSEAIAHFSE